MDKKQIVLTSEPPRTKFDKAGIMKIYFLYKMIVENAKNKKR